MPTDASGIYSGLKSIKPLTQYNLFKGITDFGSLDQFNVLDTGRPFLAVIQKPKCLEFKSDPYKSIVENAIHIMEHEFKGLDGIDDMTSETLEINDGLNTLNLINRVREQSASTVTMRYTEKSGSVLTKFAELYLRGLYDPRSGFKHYNGLIEDKTVQNIGFENEIFTLLYFLTDSSGKEIEMAYLLLAAQITKAELSIYNGTKGEHDAKEVGMEFNCFPIKGTAVNALANSFLQSMAIIMNSDSAKYNIPATATDSTPKPASFSFAK